MSSVAKTASLPDNNACWRIAKRVWPKLSDSDPVVTRAKYTNMVADLAWNNHRDYRLTKQQEATIRGLLELWEGLRG